MAKPSKENVHQQVQMKWGGKEVTVFLSLGEHGLGVEAQYNEELDPVSVGEVDWDSLKAEEE